MKKVLAIILSIAMLFSVLALNTFATTQPTVTVNNAAVPFGVDSTFTITLGSFADVAGMDVTITTTNDVTFKSVAASGGYTLDSSNTTVAAKSIHIVDLVTEGTNSITLTVTADFEEAATINVTGEFADDGTTLFEVVNASGSITQAKTILTENEVAASSTISAVSNYFIPYGALYYYTGAAYVYPEKDEYGVFDVTPGTSYTYTQYLIPESGIKTFGVSDSVYDEKPAVQFGTYCTGNDRGTLVIAGNIEALKAKFSTMTDAQLAAKLSTVYDANNASGDFSFVRMTFNGGANYVRVYKAAQTKYMWAGIDAMEYALRVYDLNDNEDYAGIGYYNQSSTLIFSDEFKG